MVTGAYMQSEVLRYVRTGAADALANAQRCIRRYGGLSRGNNWQQKDFSRKFSGGRFSNETSLTSAYACCACETFYPYANAEEQEQIREFIPAFCTLLGKRLPFSLFPVFDDNWQWPIMRYHHC